MKWASANADAFFLYFLFISYVCGLLGRKAFARRMPTSTKAVTLSVAATCGAVKVQSKSPNSKKSHTKMEISEYLYTKNEFLLKNFQKTAKNIKKVEFYAKNCQK